MKILIICTGNSCRSQMAQGYLRHFLTDRDEVYSAGLNPHGVHPQAIRVMKEDGLDISHHTSHHINDYLNQQFDYIITVCDNAAANCPTFPGPGIRYHWPFDDPAKTEGSEEHILNEFRRIRDEIKTKIIAWVKNLKN